MKITILITTYRRNESLNKIINQLNDFYVQYFGKNEYDLLICNSDKNYKLDLPEILLPYSIINNAGQGFDANLLNGFRALNSDYVYLMADDDLFAVNPFEAIDKGFGWFKKDCYLFNHVNKTDGKKYFKKKHWKNYKHLKSSLPRYCGLMYRVSFLRNIALQEFNKTLHLYCAPFIYAMVKNQVKFVKTELVIFNDVEKIDGAWDSVQKVVSGLKIFLGPCKSILPKKKFNNLSGAFFNCYFSPESWLMKYASKAKY